MKYIKIEDCEKEEVSMGYLYNSLRQITKDFGGEVTLKRLSQRIILQVDVPDKYWGIYKAEIEDKVADVLAVKYKYDYLKKKLRVVGLSSYETELLYTAIISADLEDDKRYIIRRLRLFNTFIIDGIYNFRLTALKNKWKEVVSYIPQFFSYNQLCSFINYVLGEKRGKKITVDGDKVYDVNFNRLKKTVLISKEVDVVKESLLSSSSKVEVVKTIGEREEKYLRTFFGKRVCFLQGSLRKTVDKNF